MKKIRQILFLIIILPSLASGQIINNLVPNGDFEQSDSCFDQIRGLWKVNDWDAAVPNNLCSSEYYNICQLGFPWLPKDPVHNILGKGSAAIILKATVPDHHEYLQSSLNAVLETDTTYVVKLSLKPIYWAYQTEWGTNAIEVLFSSDSIKAPIVNNFTPSRIDTCPSVVFKNSFLDTNIWYECTAYYTAKGTEQYITIGIFSPDSDYEFYSIGINYGQQWQTAYYLIDNVMVYKASDTIIDLIPAPILSNVFSPNQDGLNDVYEISNLPENSTLEVFNRWGGLVFKQAPYANQWAGIATNGEHVAEGVYFVILTYSDALGETKQLKQTLHLVR